MGIAGLWSTWKSAKGELVHSMTMLTVNADAHALMNTLHKPTEEKRMVVILPPEHHADWLLAGSHEAGNFLRSYPAENMQIHTTTTSGPSNLLLDF